MNVTLMICILLQPKIVTIGFQQQVEKRMARRNRTQDAEQSKQNECTDDAVFVAEASAAGRAQLP